MFSVMTRVMIRGSVMMRVITRVMIRVMTLNHNAKYVTTRIMTRVMIHVMTHIMVCVMTRAMTRAMTRIMTHIMTCVMTYIMTQVTMQRHDTHYDAEHVWTLKGEFRSKKSRNFFWPDTGRIHMFPLRNFKLWSGYRLIIILLTMIVFCILTMSYRINSPANYSWTNSGILVSYESETIQKVHFITNQKPMRSNGRNFPKGRVIFWSFYSLTPV